MDAEFEVIAHLPDCRNGNCSTVFRRPSDGTVRFRGTDPTDPGREIDVQWTAAEFALLAPQIAATLRQ